MAALQGKEKPRDEAGLLVSIVRAPKNLKP
jgi:hypothetical protein